MSPEQERELLDAIKGEGITLWWPLAYVPDREFGDAISLYVDEEGWPWPAINGEPVTSFYEFDLEMPRTLRDEIIRLLQIGFDEFVRRREAEEAQRKYEKQKLYDEAVAKLLKKGGLSK